MNITLAISGMTCGGCVRSVTQLLNNLPGVQQAQVDLSQHKAAVEYNPEQIQPAQMCSALDDAGFTAEPI